MKLKYLRSFVLTAETALFSVAAPRWKEKLKDYELQRKIILPRSGNGGKMLQLYVEGRATEL